MTEDDARRRRALERRARMVMRKTHLHDETDPAPIRGVAAVRLAAELSRVTWAFTGRPFPAYSRAEMPIRIVRRP